MRLFLGSCLLALTCLSLSCSREPTNLSEWPPISREHKPWTRWWWPGSAVTKEGITAELQAFRNAGLGGVEITPIYGVHGAEDRFVPFLSDQWVDLLVHTLKEAERLDLGVDIATGTGWPFGGPWVSEADACKNVHHKTYSLKGGQRLAEKISFTQPPFLRAVGSQVYEVHDNAGAEGRKVEGTRKEPLLKYDRANIKIENIRQPVESNEDLQSLALDQVQFERDLPLVTLVAYNAGGGSVDLTARVDATGTLDWTAPQGDWKLYAVFRGWHGKMVERAGPGGEGNVIDHFSSDALQHYLKKFDSAFAGKEIGSLRGFFNDSYEVDDARGAADWTPQLLEEFRNRRGYSLHDHLPALFGNDQTDNNEKILHDYRLTISELLLENFTHPWAEWAHGKQKIVRNQAHGAPANILDLYSTIDIPETEGVEPLRIRMAASAGHVSGKRLISSESATWLDEHFLSNLGSIKANVDRYLVNGVNHVLYHGTCYSPQDEQWPGWLFYAAVHLNERNPQWKDFAALNRYIARVQSFLQQGSPDNDVLLYYPIADRFSERGPEMVEHFDSPLNNFKGSSFLAAAEMMLQQGVTFDFISDAQVTALTLDNRKLLTGGGTGYTVLVVPKSRYMSLETLEKIASLAHDGARIVFIDGGPDQAAGFGHDRSIKFSSMVDELRAGVIRADSGQSLIDALRGAEANGEAMTRSGLTFTRRKLENGNSAYFIVNPSDQEFQDWVTLNREARLVIMRDPMTSKSGLAHVNLGAGTAVYLRLAPHESVLLELTHEDPGLPDFPLTNPTGTPLQLTRWELSFNEGGPVLPSAVQLDSLVEWTTLPGSDYKSFAGTANYTTTVIKPDAAAELWLLKIRNINETATVLLNGDSVATLISSPFEVILADSQLKAVNTLEVRVSNLMANRIADLDRRGIPWKKFYNVNFPSRLPENRVSGLFNSAGWQPVPAGLGGPVFLSPVSVYKPNF